MKRKVYSLLMIVLASCLMSISAYGQKTMPYMEGFEGMSSTANLTADGWSNYVPTGSASIDINTSTVYAGSKSLYINNYALSSNSDYQVVILPEISGTLSTARIKFWSKRSSGTGTIEIGYVTSANDGSTFVPLTSEAHSTTWTYYCYNLNSIPETAARLALKVANYWHNYLDELVVEQQPSCADLATGNILTVSNVTANSATITLTDESATDWQVACVPTGSDISSVTPILVQGSLTTTLTGLSDATNYQVYARRYCSATEVGAWSSAASFATQCLIAESPLFIETFESGTMNLCWSLAYLQNPGNKTTDIVTVTSTSSAYNSNYALQFAYASARTIQTFTTQQLPIDSANKYEVVFWMKRHSSESYPDEGIKVWASPMANDTTTATLLGHIHNYYASAPAEPESGYYKYYIPITVSGNYYIVFECISDYGAYVYLDDIQVRKIPTCSDIHGSVTASDFTSSSMTLAISDQTIASWDIAYGVQGTALENCSIATATGMSYNLTGLAPDTYYDFYIRHNCGNEFGEWTTSPVSARTLCLPVSTYPFVEDFEEHTSGQRLGGCYTTINQNIESGEPYESYYLYNVMNNSSYNHTEGGSNYAGLAYSSTSTSCSSTSSYEVKGIRQFQLDQSKFYEVSFWAHRYSSYNCITGVVLGQDITFDSLAFVGEHAITTGDWVQIVEYLQVPTTGVYWMGVGAKPYNGSYSSTFDDFSVRELTCIPPTGIKADKIKHNSANIIFTTNAPKSCLIVDTVKANIEAGNGTVYSNDNVTASPITIPGLSAETTYYYALRTINGTDTSVWTMPASFTTTCAPETALPFVEDFEDYEPGVVSGCWRFETTGSYYLKYLSGSTYNNTEDGLMGLAITSSATSSSATSSSNPFGLYRRFSLTANTNYKATVFAKKYNNSYSDYGFNLSLVYSDNTTGFDSTSMTTASTVRVSTTSWEEYNMYFTAPATDDYWLGFQMENNGSSYYIYLDDITIEEVAIIPPTSITVSNIAQTTATMNIESNSNMWQIVIDTIAEEVTYGRIYNDVATTSTVNLTDLVSGTTLYYAVRSINGTDTSDWSTTQSFNTMCYATVPPFADDFEDGIYGNVLAGCYWQGGIFEEGEDQFEFRFLDDFVHSGNQSIISTMKDNTYRGSQIGTVYAYRQFTLEAGKTYEVSMWGRADANSSYSSNDYSFNMDLFYGTVQDYDSMTVIATRNINGGIWMQNRGYITITADGNYFIGFNATNAGYGSYVHMDDFSVREVSCIPPTNASVTAVSPTSVTFDMGATATKYEVAIDTVEIDLSYEVATSVYQDTVFSSTPTITGLISGKSYNYVIRTICGEGDTSDWTEVQTFSLPCQPSVLPYFEDYESYETTPMIISDCITTEGQMWGVFSNNNYNHTANGGQGSATAKINTSYSGATSIGAAMFKGTAGAYRYYSLESGKTYEYSIFTKSSSNVRDFYFRILMGTTAESQKMTTLLLDSVCQTTNWFEMKATFTVPATGNYFVGYQTQTLGNAAGYTPYVDDIAFVEVVNDTHNDTICFGTDYASFGFDVTAEELTAGDNTLTRESIDSVAGVKTYTTVNLFVRDAVEPSYENVHICAGTSLAWHNLTLTETGTYSDTIANQFGCDSICFLNLYVASEIDIYDTLTYCENGTEEIIAGRTAGEYDLVDSLVAVGGCDSIVYTHLVINPVYAFSADTTLEHGESIEWFDQTISATGTYTASFTTAEGCDSIYTLNVTVKSDVENISMFNINIIPNPVKAGAMTMVYSNVENVEHVEILNNLGQVVTSFVPQSNPIEVRGIEISGIYFVRVITTEGDAYVEKLIVK